MMTPDGEMLCKDEAGKIVATTVEDSLFDDSVSRQLGSGSGSGNGSVSGRVSGRAAAAVAAAAAAAAAAA